jgi:hypothetical protein
MNFRNDVTVEQLKAKVSYDPDTGVFIWKKHKIKEKIGTIAGSTDELYTKIFINSRSYLAHRLAWLYVYGTWPKDQLDHKDRNKKNNRISNLRECGYSENCYNQVRHKGISGYHGVGLDKVRNQYFAKIMINREETWLGYFDKPELASKAYLEAYINNAGEFTPDKILEDYKNIIDIANKYEDEAMAKKGFVRASNVEVLLEALRECKIILEGEGIYPNTVKRINDALNAYSSKPQNTHVHTDSDSN